MVVKDVEVTVLIEDSKNTAKPQLKNKHGLSFFIQGRISDKQCVTILMDTGPSGEALLHNIKTLKKNLNDVDVIVLSHGHYDHTGGLINSLRQIEKPVPIVGHPTLFEPKLSIVPHLRLNGSPFRISDVEAVGGVPIFAVNPVTIADGIMSTGEVPRLTSFEKVRSFFTISSSKFVEDMMLDDQSLVIDVEGKGLVVLTGCAHAGIINTINYAIKITGNSKVYAVLGGFHLGAANEKRISATVNELVKLDPQIVGPCHCTGKKACKRISKLFRDRCHLLHTGAFVKF